MLILREEVSRANRYDDDLTKAAPPRVVDSVVGANDNHYR